MLPQAQKLPNMAELLKVNRKAFNTFKKKTFEFIGLASTMPNEIRKDLITQYSSNAVLVVQVNYTDGDWEYKVVSSKNVVKEIYVEPVGQPEYEFNFEIQLDYSFSFKNNKGAKINPYRLGSIKACRQKVENLPISDTHPIKWINSNITTNKQEIYEYLNEIEEETNNDYIKHINTKLVTTKINVTQVELELIQMLQKLDPIQIQAIKDLEVIKGLASV